MHNTDRSAPHLAIEVGGIGKRVRAAFTDLRSAPKPAGTVCLIARWLTKPGKRPWFRWYVSEDFYADTLDEALDAIRTL